MKRIKKKYLNSWAVLLAVLLTLIAGTGFLPPLTIHAEEQQEEETLPEGVVAKAIFTNGSSHQPDLYISKKITCSDPDAQIPDVIFRFEVKVDGEFYQNQPYTVLDSNGNVVESGTDENGNPLSSRVTDRYGAVELKADQTALFEYVGTGKRVTVTEVSLPDRFKVQSPPGGETEISSLPKEGASVTYINLYTPPPTPDSKTGSLKVEKKISWPAGFTYQAEEEPEFTFILTLEGSAAANLTYDLYNTNTGESKLNAGSTDAEGSFSIKAGWYAQFDNLKSGADYEVIEIKEEGWHEIAKTEHHGSTSDGNTEIFYNTNAAFSVKKTLTEGTSDKDFTFQLLDSKGTVWANAEYWLYTTAGVRITEDGKYCSYHTDSNGQFTLKQNQTAVFIGIAPGTVYSVKELAAEGYIQVNPTQAEGYPSESVKDGGTDVLVFENAPMELTGNLAVTKKLQYAQDAPLSSESFTFRLSREAAKSVAAEPAEGDGDTDTPGNTEEPQQPDDSGEADNGDIVPESQKEFVPVAGAVYTIGNTKYMTDENGLFTLKENETAVFDRLALNVVYQVEELVSDTVDGNTVTCMPVGYALADPQKAQQSGELTTNGLQFTYENTYTAKHLKLKLIKYSTDNGEEILLNGAVFGLYKDPECRIPAVTVEQDGESVAKEFTTAGSGEDAGTVTIDEKLREGTYYIREIIAPEGYALLPGIIKLEIKRTLDEEGRETFRAETSTILDKVQWEVSEVEVGYGTEDPVLALKVSNDKKKLYALPSTGGMGTYLFTVIGVAVFMTAAFQLLKSRAQKR